MLNLPITDPKNGRESHKTQARRKIFHATLDRAAVLTTILSNGECGCRGEDGNQLRLNASANLERPVQTGLSVLGQAVRIL